jgi:CheY-like chemotaxis protein
LAVSDAQASNVVPLQPVRVLIVGNDVRFLRVAAALLSFEGYSVQSCDRPRELLEIVYRHGTDVVVIDASQSVGEAARAAASLRSLPLPVAAVLVMDQEATSLAAGVPLLSKWGRFDELSARVGEAYEWRRRACPSA